LGEHAGVTALWPGVVEAAQLIGSTQIQGRCTLAGNLCNASPAGDTLVPLLVLDARVVLVSKPDGVLAQRRLPLAQFLTGPGRTARAPTELVVGVEIPAPEAGFRSEFHKFGTRPALDISTISIGVGALREGAKLRDVRVAFGAAVGQQRLGMGAEGHQRHDLAPVDLDRQRELSGDLALEGLADAVRARLRSGDNR